MLWGTNIEVPDLEVSGDTVTVTNGFSGYLGGGDITVALTLVSIINPGSTEEIGNIEVATFTKDSNNNEMAVGAGQGGGDYSV